LKSGNPMLVLIEDMTEIHTKTDLHIREIDDEVNRSIAHVQQGKMAMLPHLEELRTKLWIMYTEKVIEKLEKFVKDLAYRLSKVSEYKKKINSIRREFQDLKKEMQDSRIIVNKTQNLSKIIDLFNQAASLWNDLVDNEDDLIRDAWINFLSKVYLPFAGVASAGYWMIVQFILKWTSLTNILLVWAVILFLLYWALLQLARNPFKLESAG
jgi:hypothetical protein